VIDARLEDRRRAPVVLGRAEDDDRVGGPDLGSLVHLAALPDAHGGVGGHGGRAQDAEEGERGERSTGRRTAGGAHRP